MGEREIERGIGEEREEAKEVQGREERARSEGESVRRRERVKGRGSERGKRNTKQFPNNDHPHGSPINGCDSGRTACL